MKNVLTRNLAVRLMAVFLLSLGAAAASAQDTNAPKTELDAFEDRTGIVIVKSVGDIGTITAATGSVIVKCKESVDISSGLKQQGLAITIAPTGDAKDTTIIDYDELDALITALDYLTTVNWSVTRLSSFEALYTSRDGLRIAVHGNQRTLNDLGISLQSNRAVKVKISLTPDQFAQFRALIQQGRAKLDALRDAK